MVFYLEASDKRVVLQGLSWDLSCSNIITSDVEEVMECTLIKLNR